ncbi:hypothetical protein EAKG_04482 [Escherichia coli B574]|nr:hypothetical protein EAKG_04482 [Escherichia coli B574]
MIRKNITLPHGAQAALPVNSIVNFTTFRLNPCASGRRMLQKPKNEPEHLKLFQFQCLALPVWLMADHCRMSLSHFSFPEVSGCAASLLS